METLFHHLGYSENRSDTSHFTEYRCSQCRYRSDAYRFADPSSSSRQTIHHRVSLDHSIQPNTLNWQDIFSRKLQLAVLFAVGLFIVAITIARLPQNAKNSSMQVNRTTWASVELLAAAIVSNAPVLYGLIKGRKQRSRYAASGAESSGPSRQGLQKKSVNGTQFELQGTGHGKRGSVLSSRLSSSNYLEIGSESRQSLTRSLGR